MNAHLFYCNRWLPRAPLEKWLWSPYQAEQAHRAKTLYNVLYPDPLKPKWRIELSKGYVGFIKIDELGREPTVHIFSEVSPGVLFMAEMKHVTYVGDTDTMERIFCLTFKEDGRCAAHDDILHPFSERAHRQMSSTADISDHFLAYPAFGHYTGILEFVARWPIGPLPDSMK